MTLLKGFDVSDHNGVIDWNQVKQSGIDFVMLRAGFGSDDPNQDDKMFSWNASECERIGLKWGAYLYGYALTPDDAKKEVAHMRRLLNGKKPSFPVCYDMEDADGYKARRGMPSNDILVAICDTFLSEMEKDGHYAMLYASLDWLNGRLNSPKLDRYDKWVAQWATQCDYKGTFRMWQHTDSGFVKGVYGKVDLDIAYSDFVISRTQSYKVGMGENLTIIARKFGTDVNTLLKMNPNIKNENLIYPGQLLTVPKF